MHSPPIDSIIQIWSTFDECTLINDTVYKSNTYTEIVFKNGKCESQINLYITHDGGHAWPGGKPGGGPDSDTPSTAIHANYLLWKFFQQHSLNCPTVTASEKLNKDNFRIFPNLLDDIHAFITIELPPGNYELNVYDSMQRRVKHIPYMRGKTIMDCSDLPRGLYMIEGISGKTVVRQKFIKE